MDDYTKKVSMDIRQIRYFVSAVKGGSLSAAAKEQFAAHMMENPADFYYGVLWNKLYRREIIEKHHLQMNAEISWCEDFMFNLEYIRFAERFCVLHAPVYYYVKRKGSLVSQGNSLARTIQMKLTVFEYYHSFYKEVLDEEEYEKKRLQVYRFLVDAAGDGAVGIPFLPGTKRLGDERAGVSADAIEGEGVLSDLYRERKLLERYLEAAALKCGLTVPEMTVLLYLSHSGGADGRAAGRKEKRQGEEERKSPEKEGTKGKEGQREKAAHLLSPGGGADPGGTGRGGVGLRQRKVRRL